MVKRTLNKLGRVFVKLGKYLESNSGSNDTDETYTHKLCSSGELPIEFITTSELSDVIRDRNDVCLIVWGKHEKSENGPEYISLDLLANWQFRNHYEAYAVLKKAGEMVLQQDEEF